MKTTMQSFSENREAERISIDDQIEEVNREIKIRRNVYPNWIKIGRISQDAADRHLARMCAVLGTLQEIQRKELLI